MDCCVDRVIYDQWSYMTMLDAPEMLSTASRKGIQLDRLLFAEVGKDPAILQGNCPLTV